MTRCTHWRDASPDAVYVGPGPDPRTGARFHAALFRADGGCPATQADQVAYLTRLRQASAYQRAAVRLFASRDACCSCEDGAVCVGQVLVALGQGMTLEDAGRLWLAGRLPGMQAGLFGEVV